MAPPFQSINPLYIGQIRQLEEERQRMPIIPDIGSIFHDREHNNTFIHQAARMDARRQYVRERAIRGDIEPKMIIRRGGMNIPVVQTDISQISTAEIDSETISQGLISIEIEHSFYHNQNLCRIKTPHNSKVDEAISTCAEYFINYDIQSDQRTANRIFIRNISHGIGRDVNLNDMADDSVWPMFWHAIMNQDMTYSYSKETAKECISLFRQHYNISKRHWKFLCSKPHIYLYHISNLPSGYMNIKFPDCLMQERNHRLFDLLQRPEIQRSYVRLWMKQFFDNLYNEHQDNPNIFAINYEIFCNLISDISDIMQHAISRRQLEEILSGNCLDQIRSNVHDYERQRHIELLNPAWLGVDFAHKKEPLTKEPYTSEYPKEIERDGYKAVLINNDYHLKHEGESMSHCIFSSYRRRIKAGHYMAYHITGNELPEKGMTCGIEKRKPFSPHDISGLVFHTQSDGRIAPEGIMWQHDQTRGYKNSTASYDEGLGDFIAYITELCNNTLDKKRQNK